MGLLSLISVVAGAFLVGLVAVAALVAGWEFLRQREVLELLRRDRAVYAATSPLPLAAADRAVGGVRLARDERSISSGVTAAPAPMRREPTWIETRPMVVLSCAPAVDDETAVRVREPDLRLD